MEINYIIINKNRGWRGLAEVAVYNEDHKLVGKHIFSFSQKVWEDLIGRHTIVMQDDIYYYVIHFDDPDAKLPKADQQRSVLIKNFFAVITKVNKYRKDEWRKAEAEDWNAIVNFMKNNNYHTTSDWNCIGIRVVPEI